MGAWGEGPFDNDDAMDLLGELEDDPSPARALRRALHAALRKTPRDYLDVDTGNAAIAAAELIATARGHALEGPPAAVTALAARLKPTDALCTLACDAVASVMKSPSEVMDLWSEGGKRKALEAQLKALAKRLRARPRVPAASTSGAPPRKRQRVVPGDVLALDLAPHGIAYVLVLLERDIAVWSARAAADPLAVVATPPTFRTYVTLDAFQRWTRVGKADIPDALRSPGTYAWCDVTGAEPCMRGWNAATGSFDSVPIRNEAAWRAAEPEAVWNPHHIEDRLRSLAEGRPCVWLESLRTSRSPRFDG